MNYITIYSYDFSQAFCVEDVKYLQYSKISEVLGVNNYWLVDERDISLIRDSRASATYTNDIWHTYPQKLMHPCQEDKAFEVIRSVLFRDEFENFINES